jgi:hypothetical protein
MFSTFTWACLGLLVLGWLICIYFYYRNKKQVVKIAELEKEIAFLKSERQHQTTKSNQELEPNQGEESEIEQEQEPEPDSEISTLLQTNPAPSEMERYSISETTDRPVSGRSRSRGGQDVELQNVFLNRELQVRPKLEPFKQGQSFQPI